MSRDRVYELLAGEPERFRSGEEISRSLGISRAAVWKAVDSLRREGYGIEARTGLGYRLVAAPDALTEREIRRYLTVPCPDLRCFQEIDSTNSYLKREALAGAPHGTAAVADCQSAGRGRMARSFQSPPGKGVYLSVLLRPQLPPQALLGATGMAAVAVARAVERVSGAQVGIKWTNDLVLGGQKALRHPDGDGPGGGDRGGAVPGHRRRVSTSATAGRTSPPTWRRWPPPWPWRAMRSPGPPWPPP